MLDPRRLFQGGVTAVRAFDDVQREVDSGCDAAGGEHVAVVDDPRLGPDIDPVATEVVERRSMSDRRPTTQDSACGDEHPPGADTGDVAARRVPLAIALGMSPR